MNGLKKYPKIWLLVALALLVSACQTSQPPVHQYQWLSFMEHSVYNSVKSNEERLQSFKRRIKGIMREVAPLLSKKLNDFTNFIATEYKDMPKLESLWDGFPRQSFYETYFEKANLVEALMTLTQRQGAILRYQEEVMKKECLDC